VNENGLKPSPTILSQNYPAAISNTSGFPAHPYHHLLLHPDDDNQWLFGIHLAHGGHAGLDCG
jgi:hypothetical protein